MDTRRKRSRRRGSVVSVRFDADVLADLDTYVSDRQSESDDRRFRRATAVRELVLLALGRPPEPRVASRSR